MAKWLEGLEAAVGGGPSGPKRVRSLRWLLVLGGVGAALLILNSFLTMRNVEPSAVESQDLPPADEAAFAGRQSAAESPFESIEQTIEERLKDILEKIVGVGTVDVLVTVDSTEEVVYEKNEQTTRQTTDENDRNGGRRHIESRSEDGQVVIYESSGGQTPAVTKKIQARVRGILIVARGAENATVRNLIMDAVRKGVNVPESRVSVVPRKQA